MKGIKNIWIWISSSVLLLGLIMVLNAEALSDRNTKEYYSGKEYTSAHGNYYPMHQIDIYNRQYPQYYEPGIGIIKPIRQDILFKYPYISSPLHKYVKQHNYIRVNAHLAYGGDVNVIDNRGNTALHLAVERNYCDIVQILVDRNADPNIINKIGQTPVFGLLKYDNDEKVAMGILDWLVKSGAILDIKDFNGHTFLDYLEGEGYGDFVKIVKEKYKL